MSWNIQYRNPGVDAMLRFLAAAPLDVIVLQELTAGHVAPCWLLPHPMRFLSG